MPAAVSCSSKTYICSSSFPYISSFSRPSPSTRLTPDSVANSNQATKRERATDITIIARGNVRCRCARFRELAGGSVNSLHELRHSRRQGTDFRESGSPYRQAGWFIRQISRSAGAARARLPRKWRTSRMCSRGIARPCVAATSRPPGSIWR